MAFAADPERLLDGLVELAREAGEIVMAVREAGVEVLTKADDSPVTIADQRAEAVILAGLARLAPGVGVIAEEAAAAGLAASTLGDAFFLVDPLDGTKEFVRTDGSSDFTVNIALIRKGAPVLGVVLAPAIGRIWAGGEGRGAWSAQAPRDRSTPLCDRRAITVSAPSALGVAAVSSRSHRTPETDAYLALYPVADLVSAGSSLKFCLVADGTAQLYPRLGRTMEWDTAAGDAVLRAAGGRCVTLDGSPLRYGKRDQVEDADFANPHFVALGRLDFRALA